MKANLWAGVLAIILAFAVTNAVWATEMLTTGSDEPAIFASLGDQSVQKLDDSVAADVRGEKWEFGIYARGAVSTGISGKWSLNGMYKYTLTDSTGRSLWTFSVPMSRLTVGDYAPSIGVGGPGETVTAHARGFIPIWHGIGLDGGVEAGKYLYGSRAGKVYAEVAGGVGVGTPSIAAGFRINGVQVQVSKGSVLAVGAWARSYGSRTEVISDVSRAIGASSWVAGRLRW